MPPKTTPISAATLSRNNTICKIYFFFTNYKGLPFTTHNGVLKYILIVLFGVQSTERGVLIETKYRVSALQHRSSHLLFVFFNET